MTDLVRYSETPFQEVLEYWGDELDKIMLDVPNYVTGVSAGYTFTLPSGMEVKVEVGRNILNQEEEDQ